MHPIQSMWLSRRGEAKRREEQSLHKKTTSKSLLSNEFQRLGKSNESKGNTIIESLPFNSLDTVAHYDTHEKLTPIECPPLDDCDAVINNHMSRIFRNSLTIESSVDVKLHCTLEGRVSVTVS